MIQFTSNLGGKMDNSADLYAQAQKVIPGGVNSPARSFNGVDGQPLFIAKGEGSYIYSEAGKKYIDYVGSWGALILGHTHPSVIAAVEKAIHHGLSFGAVTVAETQLAEAICQTIPSMNMVRMVNSGTEATMSAIRLARGYTGRDKFIKFEGCYHGHSDALLVKAGSGALTLGSPSSPGVPASFTEHTLVANFNNLTSVQQLFEQHGHNIAAIIVEPITGNMNCILPEPGFLQGLRDLCDEYGSVLIFDEVMTGFRVSLGGAQERFGITPDLTTLGKIIGGGMPVGAFGGRRDIMNKLAPVGAVYQAGTLSGNPIAVAAGLENLKQIKRAGFYQNIEQRTGQLLQGLSKLAQQADIPFTTNQAGSMFGLFFTDAEKVTCYQQATACNIEHFKQFFHSMLTEGVYLAPSAFEAGFVSCCHSEEDIDKTLTAAKKAFAQLKGQ